MTSAAISLQRTESGMVSPFVGYFIDRFGPRNVMLAGILVTGLGFILLGRITSLWQFYGAFTLITLGMSFGTWMVVTTTVANWFVTMRTRALALTSAGSALGGLLVPVVIWLIATTDWRTSLIVIGVGFWVVGIPAAMVMRRRPEDYGLLPDGRDPDAADESGLEGAAPDAQGDGSTATAPASLSMEASFTVKQALKTRAFWQMAMAMGFGQLVMSASIHQIPAITSFGFSRETAGLVLLAVSFTSLIGRLGSGWVGDALDKRKVIAAAFAFQFIGTVIFANTSTPLHLVGFVVFWGLGFGASIPVRFALLADYFGRRHFGSVMGIMMTVSAIFGVVGPVFVGWMFDVRDNYRDPFMIMSLTVLVAIPLILGVTRPKQASTSG
jgi:MFS family permease